MKMLNYLLLTGSMGLALTTSQAALVPYHENFNNQALGTSAPLDNQGTAWVQATGYSIVEAPSVFSGRSYNLNRTATTSLGLPSTFNVGTSLGGQSFTQRTEFVLDSLTEPTNNNTTRVGFGLLGSNNNFSGSYYLADFVVSGPANLLGTLRIIEIGGDEGDNRVNTVPPIAINLDDVYRMSISGSYTESNQLVLNFMVENLTNPATVSMSTTYNTALAGTHFGYRNSVGQNGAMDVTLDNFSLIPEPSSYAIFFGVISFIFMLIKRRTALAKIKAS